LVVMLVVLLAVDGLICGPRNLAYGPTLHSPARARVTASAPSDDDLFASLRSRLSQTEDSAALPVPLGPDEIGADAMGPSDVIDYCMRSLRADAQAGSKALLAFAAKEDQMEDHVGQLLPGFFSDASEFVTHLASQPRYETLTCLSEFKCMGTPDFSDMSKRAAQKLLVRRDGANWEEFFVNLQLTKVESEAESALPRMRWIIISIYKQGTA